MVFKNLCVFVLRTNVASALEGLRLSVVENRSAPSCAVVPGAVPPSNSLHPPFITDLSFQSFPRFRAERSNSSE